MPIAVALCGADLVNSLGSFGNQVVIKEVNAARHQLDLQKPPIVLGSGLSSFFIRGCSRIEPLCEVDGVIACLSTCFPSVGHGDLKPSNVIEHDGNVKLIDFELGGPCGSWTISLHRKSFGSQCGLGFHELEGDLPGITVAST